MIRRFRRFPLRCNETYPEEVKQALDSFPPGIAGGPGKRDHLGSDFKPYASREYEKQMFTKAQYERSNWIFSGRVENSLIYDPKELEELPKDVPEICLVGKSNVGKSSLMYAFVLEFPLPHCLVIRCWVVIRILLTSRKLLVELSQLTCLKYALVKFIAHF